MGPSNLPAVKRAVRQPRLDEILDTLPHDQTIGRRQRIIELSGKTRDQQIQERLMNGSRASRLQMIQFMVNLQHEIGDNRRRALRGSISNGRQPFRTRYATR